MRSNTNVAMITRQANIIPLISTFLTRPHIVELKFSSRTSPMQLNARQSETLRDIRYVEMGGHGRSINAEEAQALCSFGLAEMQAGSTLSYRLTCKGWRVLADAEERLSLLVSV
jgi:hypothetical protein